MTQELIYNLNVKTQQILSTPQIIKNEIPVPENAMSTIIQGRKSIESILDGVDKRLLVVVGPCSIHDTKAAMDYATVGWKGLINDPHMDESFDIEEGLRIARRLLIDINEMGLPAGTEALDPISPQYLGDLISWSAIGARTTESQTHREMASALSSPVGFKNGTDGGLSVAVNALHSVSNPHSFLGINSDGQVAITHTKGNRYGHIVLRGGSNGPNYDSVSISLVEKELKEAKLPSNIIVDCSHANSNKDHNLQPLVFNDCVNQVVDGNKSVIGMMLESNIGPGNQKLLKDLSQMDYGVSITDACVDWTVTEKTLLDAHNKLLPIISTR
jgi:3-deoxy-7-phosphoheptulonate synthase